MEEKVISEYIRLVQERAAPYEVDLNSQPHFWEAVKILCMDKEADISSLLLEGDKTDPLCVVVKTFGEIPVYFGINHYSSYGAHSAIELSHLIANEITEWDSMSLDEIKLMLYKKFYIDLKKVYGKLLRLL